MNQSVTQRAESLPKGAHSADPNLVGSWKFIDLTVSQLEAAQEQSRKKKWSYAVFGLSAVYSALIVYGVAAGLV